MRFTFAYPSAFGISLANINPPINFLDYLQMFNGLPKEEPVLSSLLIECFFVHSSLAP
jgi:hypothetical protein